jgi:hypothetical protein
MGRKLIAVAMLLAAYSYGAKKPKSPKPSACFPGLFCIADLDWLYVQDNSILGYFVNQSPAVVSTFNLTFTMTNGGVITGTAMDVQMVPIAPGQSLQFRAHVMQNFERFDSVIDTAKIFFCMQKDGKQACGTETLQVNPPLFGPGAWRQKRQWNKTNGY